jgi:hypothetical protein
MRCCLGMALLVAKGAIVGQWCALQLSVSLLLLLGLVFCATLWRAVTGYLARYQLQLVMGQLGNSVCMFLTEVDILTE